MQLTFQSTYCNHNIYLTTLIKLCYVEIIIIKGASKENTNNISLQYSPFQTCSIFLKTLSTFQLLRITESITENASSVKCSPLLNYLKLLYEAMKAFFFPSICTKSLTSFILSYKTDDR
jgi:hypothetical protein